MAVTSSENPVVDKENDVPSGTENSLKAAAANTNPPDDVRFQMTNVTEGGKSGCKKSFIFKLIMMVFLSMAVGSVGGIFVYREIGDPEFAGGHEVQESLMSTEEATTTTNDDDEPLPPPPLIEGGTFGGVFPILPADDQGEPPFLLGGHPEPVDVTFPVANDNFIPSDNTMPTGGLEDISHHSFTNRRGPSKVDYTQISCDFDTPCGWYKTPDWTVQNKTIGNVSDVGTYFSGYYLLYHKTKGLSDLSTIVTNDVLVNEFKAVFCLSFVYYMPGPSGVLSVQIVDSNTGDLREMFTEREYSNVWRKNKITINTSNDFVLLFEVEGMLNDSMVALDNVVLTNETCIYTQESENNHPSTTAKRLIPTDSM